MTGRFHFSEEDVDGALIDFGELNVEWDVQKSVFKKNNFREEGGDL